MSASRSSPADRDLCRARSAELSRRPPSPSRALPAAFGGCQVRCRVVFVASVGHDHDSTPAFDGFQRRERPGQRVVERRAADGLVAVDGLEAGLAVGAEIVRGDHAVGEEQQRQLVLRAQRFDERARRGHQRVGAFAHAAAGIEREDDRHRRVGFVERIDLLLDAVFRDDEVVGADLDVLAGEIRDRELQRRPDRRRLRRAIAGPCAHDYCCRGRSD